MKLAKELTYDRPEIEFNNDWKDDIKQSKANLEHLKSLAKKAREFEAVLGSYFSVNVADGRVHYQVVEVDEYKRTGIVRRCAGICLDRYVHELLGEECELPLSKITEFVNRETALNKLFG